MNYHEGQKIYIYDGGVETWIYHKAYDDLGTVETHHMINNGAEVKTITAKELRKFSTTEDECVNQICKKYFNIQNQCKEKMQFLNKEITTLTKVVVDTKDKIKAHKVNRTKLLNALDTLMTDFQPIKEQYLELFI